MWYDRECKLSPRVPECVSAVHSACLSAEGGGRGAGGGGGDGGGLICFLYL